MCFGGGSSAPAAAPPPPPPPPPPPTLEQSAPQTAAPKTGDSLATKAVGTKQYRTSPLSIDSSGSSSSLNIPS
jgi:hypothetical protein